MVNQNNNFNNVVWTDETSVQLENHRRFCHRKRRQKPRLKPRYVHNIHTLVFTQTKTPTKGSLVGWDQQERSNKFALIWGCNECWNGMWVFFSKHIFLQCKLYLEKSPKHTSKCTRNVLVEIGLSGGICTPPPESPDLWTQLWISSQSSKAYEQGWTYTTMHEILRKLCRDCWWLNWKFVYTHLHVCTNVR